MTVDSRGKGRFVTKPAGRFRKNYILPLLAKKWIKNTTYGGREALFGVRLN